MTDVFTASKIMTNRTTWPLLRAQTTVVDAIRILRIFSEDTKLESGHSILLVFTDSMELLGFVRLVDLIKHIRHIPPGTGKTEFPTEAEQTKLIDIMVKFSGDVKPDDDIYKALDIMIEHGVSLVPVIKEGKLEGIIKLADVFSTLTAIILDKEEPNEAAKLMRGFHF